MPASSILAWPWIEGSLEHTFKKGDDSDWIKTPRTKTKGLESLKDDRTTAQSFDGMLAKKGLDRDYALKQLLIYSHEDPKKSEFYNKLLNPGVETNG